MVDGRTCVNFNKYSFHLQYSGTPLIRSLVIRIANYPNQLGSSGKFVDNSIKLTCLENTGYRIKYSTVLCLIELQIRRVRRVWTQVHTLNRNSRTSNRQCSLFSKKNPNIWIFCIPGWLTGPINPDRWSSTVPCFLTLHFLFLINFPR